MEDPNEAFRGQPGNGHHPDPNGLTLAPSQSSHHVSVPSSTSNNHVNVHSRRQTKSKPNTGGLKTEPNAVNTETLWNANSNLANLDHAFSQSINVQTSQKRPPVQGLANEYVQAYGFPQGLAHGLPNFSDSQTIGPSLDFGSTLGGVPNVGSSSSSSCRVNGSSPNTVFGSFSSSIGPPDMMDMDMTDECFHSPSAFPSDVLSCQTHGPIPPALMSRSAVQNFSVTPGVAFPEAETVSPKMLNLQNVPSLPSSSSSESLPNPFPMDSDSELTSAVAVPQQNLLSSSSQARREPVSKANNAGRKQLPDKAPDSITNASSNGSKRRHGGEASGDKSLAPSVKKPKAKTNAPSQTQPQSSSHHHHNHKGGSETRPKTAHSKTKASSSKATTSAGYNGDAADDSTTQPRSEKDEFLVQSKLAGMTYKEIRKKGGFTEAESTLRGRFRTLTKPKEARVRKPEFQEIDVSTCSGPVFPLTFAAFTHQPRAMWLCVSFRCLVSSSFVMHMGTNVFAATKQDKLLKRAVTKLTKDIDEVTRDNVPWKLVSEYMINHGGSYLFGYTTVRKRWEYLMVTSDEQVKKDRLENQGQI